VLVRLSALLGQRDRATPSRAEGPASRRDRSIHAAYCYRRAAVAWLVHPCGLLLQTHSSSGVVGPSMPPIATDTQQQWCGRSIHAAYCYRRTAAVAWSVHPCGLLLQTHSNGVVGPSMRPIATDAQQWRGQSIHEAYCYRRTAVAWSVHPCGLLLQTHSSGVISPSMRSIATDAQQWRGRSIHAAYCYRRAAVAWSVHQCGLLLQTCTRGAVQQSTRPIAIGALVEQPGGQRTGSALLF